MEKDTGDKSIFSGEDFIAKINKMIENEKEG
jgi:hypothetical protein